MNEEQVSSEELLEFIAKCDKHDEEFMRQMFIEIFMELTLNELEKAS